MSFGNPSELFLLARICFVRLMLFSVSACVVFVASTERKIGLLPSMAIYISVTTCDACAADHVVRFTRPFPSVFAYCKRSKTGAREGLGTRLEDKVLVVRKLKIIGQQTNQIVTCNIPLCSKFYIFNVPDPPFAVCAPY